MVVTIMHSPFNRFNTQRLKLNNIFITALSGLLFLLSGNLLAQGDLLITPRRVVFEGSRRSFDLNLANTGKDTATYSISIVEIRMKDDGTFEMITQPDPGQQFADKYIRFFPRSVTLGPGEAQVVKVQMTRTGELKPGEYRSHFYFRSVPKPRPLGEKEQSSDTNSISVRLTPIFGITIPIIIRVGESNTRVSLTNLNLEMVNDSIPRISFTFNREGNMSVYGDVTVDYISTEGKIIRVGTAIGVAVYTPNKTRRFGFNLLRIPGVDYSSGTLRVIYSSSSDVKPERYAEAELAIN